MVNTTVNGRALERVAEQREQRVQVHGSLKVDSVVEVSFDTSLGRVSSTKAGTL